jgi:hypothetical protein
LSVAQAVEDRRLCVDFVDSERIAGLVAMLARAFFPAQGGPMNEAGLCTTWLSPRTSCLLFFGNPSIRWSPTVHSVAIRTLRKRNSVGKPIDLGQIDIDVRRNQSF